MFYNMGSIWIFKLRVLLTEYIVNFINKITKILYPKNNKKVAFIIESTKTPLILFGQKFITIIFKLYLRP